MVHREQINWNGVQRNAKCQEENMQKEMWCVSPLLEMGIADFVDENAFCAFSSVFSALALVVFLLLYSGHALYDDKVHILDVPHSSGMEIGMR